MHSVVYIVNFSAMCHQAAQALILTGQTVHRCEMTVPRMQQPGCISSRPAAFASKYNSLADQLQNMHKYELHGLHKREPLLASETFLPEWVSHCACCFNSCRHAAGSSENAAIIEMVAGAQWPEEAARLGRQHQRSQPAAVRPDWDHAKLQVMLAALRAKVYLFSPSFACNCSSIIVSGLRLCLLASHAGSTLGKCIASPPVCLQFVPNHGIWTEIALCCKRARV